VIAFWSALGVAVAGIVGGVVVASVRGLRAWRDFKAIGRKVGVGLEGITRSAGEIETHLSLASESSERLSLALEKLRRSRSILEVQVAALREARDAVTRVVPFLGTR
jgi:hypothetical protein